MGPCPAAGARGTRPASSDPGIRASQIDAIVASGEAILGVFAERHNAVMLEVMTRRYYRIRPLKHVQVTEQNVRPLLTAEYVHDGRDYLVIATVADGSENVAGIDLLPDGLPSGRTVLVDLYLTSQEPEDEGDADLDAPADTIRGQLGPIPATVERVAVAVRRADGAESGAPAWFTFTAGRTGRWKTGRSVACIRWSPNGWACGGSPRSS